MRPTDEEQNTATPEELGPRMVGIDAVAAYLGVSVRHVRRLVNERRIPFYKWSRLLRFDPAQAVRAFASFEPEPSKKFDKIYEVYSQRFRQEDFGEEDKFDPTVLPEPFRFACEVPEAERAFRPEARARDTAGGRPDEMMGETSPPGATHRRPATTGPPGPRSQTGSA